MEEESQDDFVKIPRALLKDILELMNYAMYERDGDTFGKYHNDATDTISEIENILSSKD